jgi:hypothetical protein
MLNMSQEPTGASQAQSLQQQRMREFLQMLPLTTEIAGLPPSAQGAYFSEGQMENRAIAMKAAFKIAKQIMKGIAG